jgi:hypothetical protein
MRLEQGGQLVRPPVDVDILASEARAEDIAGGTRRGEEPDPATLLEVEEAVAAVEADVHVCVRARRTDQHVRRLVIELSATVNFEFADEVEEIPPPKEGRTVDERLERGQGAQGDVMEDTAFLLEGGLH